MREIKDELLAKLQESRAVVLAKATGLAEYDRRRPLTPTGTNLLGLVKHLTGMEYGYLGECLGRPADPPPPWFADDPSSGTDMWASPEESGEGILAHYRRACAHADETVRRSSLETPAHVPWWAEADRDTTLCVLLIRMVAETAQHAGHADIVRELVDGQAGSPQDPVPRGSAVAGGVHRPHRGRCGAFSFRTCGVKIAEESCGLIIEATPVRTSANPP